MRDLLGLGSDLPAWSGAVSALLGRQVTVRAADLDADLDAGRRTDGGKAHGMTRSVRLVVDDGGRVRRAFLKTPCEGLYGEALAADAVRELAWRLEGYPWFAGHARCAAVGRMTPDGLVRVDQALEQATDPPWVLEWAEPGTPYARRLSGLATIGPAAAAAEARLICVAMVALHRPVQGNASALYRRAVRDALIGPAHRLIDSADAFWSGRIGLRLEVERACARWRVLLADRHDRLRYVHHDFHPWNVLYLPETGDVRLIGARLPGVGDPYDDVAAFAVNYLWFGHARSGRVEGAYAAGFAAFRRTYLELTEGAATEPELMSPFLAKRLLVLLNPAYYPDMPEATAAWLEDLLRRCLDDGVDLLRGEFGETEAGT
ncbi:hypothetical protein J5X84_14840 [Streptosporangiaceae bacterium NEAU-GS5]|nr:hypothetical protein [Streptosporangiaceae bacterium NEAU-GS5]